MIFSNKNLKNENNLPTLAFWYQRANDHAVKQSPPMLELHVNLWRRVNDEIRSLGEINYLDIGVRIIDARDLGTISIYVPFEKDDCIVSDLSRFLKSKEISSAIFNELLEVLPIDGCDSSFYIKKGMNHYLTIHEIDVEADINYERAYIADKFQGFVLTLNRDFCEKFQDPGEHYIRLRFALHNKAHEVFSSNVSDEDGWILSSITSSEITEIRINEVRSIPFLVQELSKSKSWNLPNIDVIHYFLVRDLKFDLVASHANFRKIRRMENVWDRYLEFPNGSARNMLIYHWKTLRNGNSSVEDFVTLAKFRRSKENIKTYLLIVIAIGSLGSGIFALLSAFINTLLGLSTTGGIGETILYLISTAIIISLIIVILICKASKRPWKKRS